MNKKAEKIKKHYKLFKFATHAYSRLNPKNSLRAKGVSLSYGVSLIKGLKIINNGKNNQIVLGDFVRIKNCTVIIRGNNNSVTVGDFSYLNQAELYLEDDGNEISIGKHTSFCGRGHFAAIEGTRISVGDNCLFSGDLHFRTGDSHSITDENGKRINPSKDICIDDHVWIGTRVTCLKGVHVAENCVVAATATLCKAYDQKNCGIGGVPAKVLKIGINWDNNRIK